MPVKLIKYSYFESDAKAIYSMLSQKELSEDNDARRAAIITKQKPWLKFVKSMWNFKVKVTRSKIIAPCEKGHVTRNSHVLYESPISSGKKVMAKAKEFQK